MVLGEIRTPMSRPLPDRGARNSHCALHLSRRVTRNDGLGSRPPPTVTLGSRHPFAIPTNQSRSVSACCRGWVAESRGVQLLFSCSRGIRRALGELRSAPSRRGFARPCAAIRQVRLAATLEAAVSLRATPLPRSCPPAPAPPRIRWRFAVREHFPATNNRATSGMHPVKRPAPVCPVVEKIA